MAAYDPYPGLVRLWKELECRNLGNTVSPCRKRKKERGKEERKEDWTGGKGGGGNPSNSALWIKFSVVAACLRTVRCVRRDDWDGRHGDGVIFCSIERV